MKRAILILLSVLIFSNVVSGYEREIYWIHGDSPAEYDMDPNAPTTSDLISFSVPLDVDVFDNQYIAEQAIGGTPTLSINPELKEIMLEFQEPPSAPYSPEYDPVCGLRVRFGPLEQGNDWVFVFRYPGYLLWENFDVVPGDPKAGFPYPHNGAINVPQSLVLRWRAGSGAERHDIYFGSNRSAVINATRLSSLYRDRNELNDVTYEVGPLSENSDYYWRIDEVQNGTIQRGDVWSFTTAGFIVNDDFESFTSEPGNRIFDIWRREGGATVGYAQAPYVDREIVFYGKQSMPLSYSHIGEFGYSAAKRLPFTTPQNWVDEVDFLFLYVHGRPGNDRDQLYVEIEDIDGRYARVFNTNTNIVQRYEWTPWRIPLSEFTGGIGEIEIPGSINLRQVTSISIGIGNPPPHEHIPDGGLLNDECVDAIPISGNVSNHHFDTTHCQPDGPAHCLDSPNIWYCYTAQRTCRVTVSLCGSSFDTMLAVYEGCGCYPQQNDLIGCNDDACGSQSEITFNALAGNKYLIEVGGWTHTSWGEGVMNISCDDNYNNLLLSDGLKPLANGDGDANEGTINVDSVNTVGTDFGVLRGRVTSSTGLTIQNPVFQLTPDFPEWIAPDGSYVIFLLQPNDFTVNLTASGYVMRNEDRKVQCHTWDVEKHFTMDP